MRLLFVTPFYAPEYKFGGPTLKIAGLARRLDQRGHSVNVLTFHSERPRDCGVQQVDGVAVQYLRWAGRGLRQFPTSSRLLRRAIVQADVAHFFGLYNLICPFAGHYASRFGVPFFVEPMGMSVPRVHGFARKRIYNRLITQRLFGNAAAVIATSELEAEEIRASGMNANVVIRRNGIRLNERVAPDEIQTIRGKWGIDSHQRVIGYFGRISAKKRLVELVEAFSRAEIGDAKLVIAGPVSEPQYEGRVRKAIGSSARRQSIVLTGPMYGREYAAALRALDVFVLPSENENFGNAAGEAVAAGIPTLVTRQCGIAPIIHEQFGLAVDQGIENLRRGLEQILDPATRKRWSFDCRKIEAALGWEQPVNEMIGLYEEAVKKSGNGGAIRKTLKR